MDNDHADTRQQLSPASPHWLRAVGKLHIPTIKYEAGRRSNHVEDCSATLVTVNALRKADTIVTAWHCLEHYRDLSKTIVFTLMPNQNEQVQRQAYRLADGGSMAADWAILRLERPITGTDIYPLKVNPVRADPQVLITMAGYSKDKGKGKEGKSLSYDADCQIIAQRTNDSHSDCIAHKGASGGAVVQLSNGVDALYSGVISSGDGAGLSTFIPVSGFRSALSFHLR